MTVPEPTMFYYVAVHNADRSALLAGPYATEAGAQAAMDKTRQVAEQLDPWSWFYTFSLAKTPHVIKTRFGPL
jgi:hypothetical protein